MGGHNNKRKQKTNNVEKVANDTTVTTTPVQNTVDTNGVNDTNNGKSQHVEQLSVDAKPFYPVYQQSQIIHHEQIDPVGEYDFVYQHDTTIYQFPCVDGLLYMSYKQFKSTLGVKPRQLSLRQNAYTIGEVFDFTIEQIKMFSKYLKSEFEPMTMIDAYILLKIHHFFDLRCLRLMALSKTLFGFETEDPKLKPTKIETFKKLKHKFFSNDSFNELNVMIRIYTQLDKLGIISINNNIELSKDRVDKYFDKITTKKTNNKY